MHNIHVPKTPLLLLSFPGVGKELRGYITKYKKFSKFLAGLNLYLHSWEGKERKKKKLKEKNYLKRATIHRAFYPT